MRKFLDSNARRKVEILIILNKENGVTFDVLGQRLNVTRPTIIRDLEEIKAKFSLHQILIHYLNESLQYQAMVDIFHSESIQLREFSESHFVSYNTLYKKLYRLNEVLAQFDLKFETNKKASVSGNELQLRFFTQSFFGTLIAARHGHLQMFDKKQSSI